jgi:molybdenum cofactor guanylyltransferase
MQGQDKGLQSFGTSTLAMHSAQRLALQVQGRVLINANRHLERYAALGYPVHADVWPGFAGPLAGFLTGLSHGQTPLLVTCPCDTPLFPIDYVQRLAAALSQAHADIAMACTPTPDGPMQPQPVFCLLKSHLQPSLHAFLSSDGRSVEAWATQQRHILVPFDRPGDLRAFSNANTREELLALERSLA